MKKITFLFCLLFCLCACKATNKTTGQNIQNRGNAIIRNGATNHYQRQSPFVNDNNIETPAEFDKQSSLTERRSQTIAESVTKVKGVDKASVVLNNNAAIIGIEISGEYDDAALIKLKHDVEDEVRQTDKNIERVAVTASKELVERITKMANFVATEKPSINPNSKTGKIIQQLTPVI